MVVSKFLSLEQFIACGIEESVAIDLLPQINHSLTSLPAAACWQQLTQTILKPNYPFALHQLLYETTFSDWNLTQGSPPAWFPTPEKIHSTNVAAVMQQLQIRSYSELHSWSVQNRPEYWELMIQRLGIQFRQKYSQLVDLSQGIESPHWLVNARFNIIESCFQASSHTPAIIFQAEDQSIASWTYAELEETANRVANGLVELGLQPGDRIAIAMPMTAESIAIYLGIIKAGYVVVSIADSFAASEIAVRFQITQAKAIFTQDWIVRSGKQLPLYQKVIDANAPTAIVLSQNKTPEVSLRPTDLTWQKFLSDNSEFDAVIADAATHTNILFSSGTTGAPKAIPWTHTTPIKCAADAHLHHDIHPGDVLAWPTNLGWMMGPWLIYASLINRATIALYYGAPNQRQFGEFIQNAHVTMLGIVPSLVNTWKTADCMRGLDWSAIKAFSSTGECSNPQDMLFLMSLAGYKPIVEYCGGTEIGGGYITGTLVQPCAPSTFTTPALGLDLVILDDEAQPAEQGEVFIIPPSIGLSTELLNKDHHQVYFANTPTLTEQTLPLRRHGDQLERLPNGYYRAQGRVDDTMNLAGIKISAIEIEQVLNTVNGICETAAIAIPPETGGPNQLIIYAVTRPEIQKTKADLLADLQQAIKQQLNPLFKIHNLVITETLPRTASNKMMRRLLRDQYKTLTHQPVCN